MELVRIVGPDGEHNPVLVDETADADALVLIDVIHNRIHRGHFFSLDVVDAALINTGTILILVRVAAGKSAHIRFEAAVGGDARLEMFEDPTTSADGTAITPLNRNRFSSNVATTLFFSGPTVTADGTSLSDKILAGGAGIFLSPGSEGSTFKEWVLNEGDYLVRLTNISGATQPAHLQTNFYENFE